MSQRFVTRAAWGSFALALAAALFTATATGGLASVLLQGAEDRRLEEAALVLAAELTTHLALDGDEIEHIVAQERAEHLHWGVVFAVVTSPAETRAGEPSLANVAAGRCETLENGLRACSIASSPHRVIAAAVHATTGAWLLTAGALASLGAAFLALLASRPLAATVVAPLSALEARVASVDANMLGSADLGPPSSIVEVDSLRERIIMLVQRVDGALLVATRFASDAAHELRTPLSVIQGEVELLGDGDSLSGERLTCVRVTVARLAVMVDRLLVLATPGEPAVTELVSMRDAVEDTVALLPLADQARVTLELTNDFSLRGDATLLSLMISNALSNALKFGSKVTVRLREHALEFEDDGPGVPLDEQSRVFEPLYRGRQARASRVQGHGLGLALIAHVARQHGAVAAFEGTVPGARLLIRFTKA